MLRTDVPVITAITYTKPGHDSPAAFPSSFLSPLLPLAARVTADRLPPRVLIIIAQLVAREFLCTLRESIESDQDSA